MRCTRARPGLEHAPLGPRKEPPGRQPSVACSGDFASRPSEERPELRIESGDTGEAGNIDDHRPCRGSRTAKHQGRTDAQRGTGIVFPARVLNLTSRRYSSRTTSRTFQTISDKTPRFLQPLTGALHLFKIGDQPLEWRLVDRALAFHFSVAEKRKDDSARQFFLLKKLPESC